MILTTESRSIFQLNLAIFLSVSHAPAPSSMNVSPTCVCKMCSFDSYLPCRKTYLLFDSFFFSSPLIHSISFRYELIDSCRQATVVSPYRSSHIWSDHWYASSFWVDGSEWKIAFIMLQRAQNVYSRACTYLVFIQNPVLFACHRHHHRLFMFACTDYVVFHEARVCVCVSVFAGWCVSITVYSWLKGTKWFQFCMYDLTRKQPAMVQHCVDAMRLHTHSTLTDSAIFCTRFTDTSIDTQAENKPRIVNIALNWRWVVGDGN